ncbi:MAG: transposase [Patescibacteria group bacterium]
MPSRNTIRFDADESYYHVYARGASKQPVFLEVVDYVYFINLFKRYLSDKEIIRKSGGVYPNYHVDIKLLAYCLMGNHFHLLVYQKQKGSLSEFMKSLISSYCRYFNLKYKRSGSLFENRYKSSIILQDNYLQRISRYIHLNPRNWKRYPYSSINYYRKGNEPSWLSTDQVLEEYTNRASYINFVEDYEEYKEMLTDIKHELADT